MKRFNRLTGSVLIGAMMLGVAGCGKQNLDTIDDYGSTSGGTVFSEEGSTVTVGDGDLGESIAELGAEPATDEFGQIYFDECVDEFQVGSAKVTRDIKDYGWSQMEMPVFTAERVTAETFDADGYAKKLFGNTAKKLSEKPRPTENYRKWYEYGFEGTLEYSDEEYWKMIDEAEDIWYAYEGLFEGKEYYLLATFESETYMASLKMFPKDAGSIIGETALPYMTRYDPAYFEMPDVNSGGSYVMLPDRIGYVQENGELIMATSGELQESEIPQELNKKSNRCTLSDSQLENRARDLFEGTLGINISQFPVDVNCSDQYMINMIEESANNTASEEAEGGEYLTEDAKVELVFTERNNFPNINYDTAVVDGYSVEIIPAINNLSLPHAFSDYGNSMGHIDIAEEGIVGFEYSWRYEFKETLENDSVLLDFKGVMACMKRALEEGEEFANLGVTGMTFNDMYYTYSPIFSAEDFNKVTFVPAVNFMGINNGISNYGLTLNAIDGSVISEGKALEF